MCRRNKRQSNSSYMFAERQNVVLDVYGMSFGINNGIWVVSLVCLNTWIINELCSRKCGSDVLGQDHLHAIIEHVKVLKDDIPHHQKNHREIRAYRSTSRWTCLLTRLKFYTTFMYSFRAILSNILVMNKQNAGCSHFFCATLYYCYYSSNGMAMLSVACILPSDI